MKAVCVCVCVCARVCVTVYVYACSLLLLYTEVKRIATGERLPQTTQNLVLLSTSQFTLDDNKEMEIKRKLGDQLKDSCTKDFVDRMSAYLRPLRSCH